MSRNRGAPVRAESSSLAPPLLPLRLAAILLPAVLAVTTIGAAGVAAERPSAVTQLSAGEAASAGLGLAMARRQVGTAELVELRGTAGGHGRSMPSLLAVSLDGSLAALADVRGQDPTSLTIARADGSQLRVAVQGALAAAFAADASALAFVDGLGRLAMVDLSDGAATAVSDGPFLGPLSVGSDGSVLALSVSSVEAPFASHVVRVAPDGSLNVLSDEALAYAASPLADGSLAIVAHRTTGTVVQQVRDGVATMLVDLGPGAINVSVAPNAAAVAFERGGDVFVQQLGPQMAQSHIGSGSNPRYAPDGSELLVDAGGASRLVALDGTILGEFAASVAFVACPAGCAS